MCFLNRIISFIKRARRLSALTGGFIRAVITIIRIRKNQEDIQSVSYKNIHIMFRGYDERVLHEIFIDKEYAFLSQYLSNIHKPVVLDIGAHIGAFAIWVISINKEAKILSVEADPATYQIATLNLTALTSQGIKWYLIQGAASDTDGEKIYFSNTGSSLSHHLDKSGNIEVETVSLSSLINRIVPEETLIDLLKVDIEGAEEDFLCTNPEVLKKVRAIVVELHPNLCDVGRVKDTLNIFFNHIDIIRQRKSTKPLLFCMNC